MVLRNRRVLSFLMSVVWLASLVILVASCAGFQQKVYHGALMRGSIVDVSDSEVYLCIGSNDGASVGQELNVYRITSKLSVGKERQFEREQIGKVKILEIINEHFAKAKVISGKAEKNDIVELEKKS